MSRILDGAGISLDRQLDMIRHIYTNNEKGLTFQEIHFHIGVRHGLSEAWVVKYLKQWSKWGVVTQNGTRFHVNEAKLKQVWKARDQGFDVFGP